MLRVKSTLLDTISHELRTPLTGMLGYAEVLLEEVNDPHREFASAIVTHGRRLMHTLNSVLDLAQLEGGEAPVERERLSVGELLEEAAREHRSHAEEKGLSIEVIAPEREIAAVADRSALQRVLHHLVDNAVKFTEEGGVTLRAGVEDEQTVICVQDTGVGIGPDFRDELFEAFKQESAGWDRTYEGAGLGLAITKGFVERMDGTVRVRSQKGEGTEVEVRLPHHASTPAPAG